MSPARFLRSRLEPLAGTLSPRARRQRGKRHPDHRAASWSDPITLRLAAPTDREQLRRLAERETRQDLPPPPLLVAERAGRIEAALSLRNGEAVADPFRRTAETVALLRVHAGGARVAGPAERPFELRPVAEPAPPRAPAKLVAG